jgi:hypothetical protein
MIYHWDFEEEEEEEEEEEVLRMRRTRRRVCLSFLGRYAVCRKT